MTISAAQALCAEQLQICFQVFLIFLFAKFLLWGPAHCIVRFGGLGIGAGCSVVAAGKLFPKLEKYREEKGDRVKGHSCKIGNISRVGTLKN